MRRVGALCAVLAALTAATVAPASGAAAAASACVSSVGGLDLQHATIADMEGAMAAGRISSAKLVKAYEARIAAYDTSGPKLNAIRALNPQAVAEARKLDVAKLQAALQDLIACRQLLDQALTEG